MTNTTTPLSRADGTHALRVEWAREERLVRVALKGEADISTLEHLDSELVHVELDGAAAVHVDLTRLDFADVATIRRLAAFAGDARRTGHDVRTCGASRTLRRVATLLDGHDDLGLAPE